MDLLPVEQNPGAHHPSPPNGGEREQLDTEEDGRPIYGSDPDDVFIEIQGWSPVLHDAAVTNQRVGRMVN